MTSILYMPIEVEALMINENTKALNTYKRSTLNYKQLEISNQVENNSSEGSIKDGAHVKWTLPEALRSGRQNFEQSDMEFPLIPNRWLVVRFCNTSNALSKAWVVQSDFLSNDATNSYVDPFHAVFTPTRIGQKVEVSQWSETNEQKSFLTAIGSGDMAFSVFQPFNENVLSLHDDLQDIKGCQNISYFVCGWYSNKTDDFVQQQIVKEIQEQNIEPKDLQSFMLNEYHLALSNDANISQVQYSLYSGGVLNIDISTQAYECANKPKEEYISIAVGNTASDALGATIKNNEYNSILQGFNEHLMHALDEANGKYVLHQALHSTWFSPIKSGNGFVCKDKSNDEKLQQLNEKQQQINDKIKQLHNEQANLFRVLYTKNSFEVATDNMTSREKRKLRVDFSQEELEADIIKLQLQIKSMQKKRDDLQEEVSELKKGMNIDEIAQDNYFSLKDPTVMFIGVNAKKYDDAPTLCQVDSFENNKEFLNVPNGVEELYEKFLSLNGLVYNNSAVDNKSLLDEGLQQWKQPWFPLFMQWSIEYYPIDFEEGWQFNAQEYAQVLQNEDKDSISLSGKTFITSNNTYNLKNLLEQFKQNYCDLTQEDKTHIDALIEKVANWDHLSQSLDEMSIQLIRQTTQTGKPIDKASLRNLIGDMNYTVPNLGALPTRKEYDPEGFTDFRSGSFVFTSLSIVDAFGQSINVISSNTQNHKEYFLSQDMQAKSKNLREVLLRPRFLQSCRLNFDLISPTNNNEIIQQSSTLNPIFAWVLPNHLDKSLDFYNNEGERLGSVVIITQRNGTQKTLWEGQSIEDENLKKLLSSPLITQVDSYKNFFETIDKTLWSIDPLGDFGDSNLEVILGRPLALVRAKIAYELKEKPVVDRGWQGVTQYRKPEFINYNLPILLGSNELRCDGLVGFFEEENYEQFNCVHLPSVAKEDTHIKHISSQNLLDLKVGSLDEHNQLIVEEKCMTLLMDPRGKVHATTHILPVKTLDIPNKFVQCIKNIQVRFRMDSLLTNFIQENSTNEQKVSLPLPATKSGKWTFESFNQSKDVSYNIMSTHNDMANINTNSTIQSGHLKFNKKV